MVQHDENISLKFCLYFSSRKAYKINGKASKQSNINPYENLRWNFNLYIRLHSPNSINLYSEKLEQL